VIDFRRLRFLSFRLGALGLCVLGAFRPAGAAGTLDLKKGDAFTFETQNKASAASPITNAQGAILVDALPTRQVVKVTDAGDCEGKKCITLQADRDLPPPSADQKNEKLTEKLIVKIDAATGDVLHMSSTVSGGGSTSTSTQDQFGRTVTISDFYGPWMLDVDDKYKRSGSNGSISASFETVGHGKVQGHDCFQVRKTLTVGGRSLVRTYWIDTRRHVVLKIEEQGGPVLSLTR
jgi:hypothetical protein